MPEQLDAQTKRSLEGLPEDEDDDEDDDVYDLLYFLLAEDDEEGTIFRRSGMPALSA